MSTNKTQNYQLHGWASEDEHLRTELNANFTKLDTALKAEETARAGAISTLNTALGKKAEVVTGRYTGNGQQDRTITLGFTPKAVLVMREDGYMGTSSNRMGGLAGEGMPCQLQLGTYNYDIINLVPSGFQVHYEYWNGNPGTTRGTNVNGDVYYYLAIR